MKRFGLLRSVGLLIAVSAMTAAQQFRISNYDGESITLEYPPSFAGAYLFVEQSTNLVSSDWDAFGYIEVSLEEGAQVVYSPSVEAVDSSSTNVVEVPYVITPEYIEAVTSGEITNAEWTANAATSLPPQDKKSWFSRITGISFIDSDGDGVDNVSEYGAGTDPYTNDAPEITLPVDDGDPRPVPGSVDSAPGDWNTRLQPTTSLPSVYTAQSTCAFWRWMESMEPLQRIRPLKRWGHGLNQCAGRG